jgi:membrane protein YqaA with SNARE-associated domain
MIQSGSRRSAEGDHPALDIQRPTSSIGPLTAGVRKLRAWMRWLYDWTLHWSKTPYAAVALFLIAFAESSFFPIPPDVLLIAMVVAVPLKFFRYALICTLGSVFGGMFGYYIGHQLMETVGWKIIDFYNARSLWDEFQAKYTEYGGVFLAVAAFTPIPYKVATIASGATRLDFVEFIIISSLGRAGRFFLVAGLLRLFGQRIKAFIEKYFDILSLLFVILLVGGFVVIKYFV